MTPNQPIGWRPWRLPKQASEVGPWPNGPTLFLPVTWGTLPYMKGALLSMLDAAHWTGTTEEIEQAFQTLRWQMAAAPLSRADVCALPMGAEFRTPTGLRLEARQSEGLPPPPWEFRLIPTEGGAVGRQTLQFRTGGVEEMAWVDVGELPAPERGPQGDRFWLYGTTPAPHVLQPYSQLQRFVDGAWEDIGLPEALPQIVAPEGAEGPTGGYFKILQDADPENPTPDHVAFFYRQFHNAAGEPQEDPVLFGGVIAPDGPTGPKGDKGDKGDRGERGEIGPIGQPGRLPLAGEWVAWSFAAYQIAVGVAEAILFVWDNNLGAQLWATLRNLWGTVVPMDDIDLMIGSLNPATVEALGLDATREEAAKLIYCQMVQYMGLSDVELSLMSDNLGSYLLYLGDPTEAHLFLAAYVLESAKLQGRDFRAAVQFYRAAAVGRTEPDYSELPCTPVVGVWNHVFDFTVNPWGFAVDGGQGEYVPGEGWHVTYDAPSGEGSLYTVHATLVMPAPMALVQAELLATDINHTSGTGRGLYLLDDGDQWVATTENGPLVTLLWFAGEGPPRYVSALGVRLRYVQDPNGYIRRLSIAGLGEKPTFGQG